MHPADLTVALHSERRVTRYKGSATYNANNFLLTLADYNDFLSACKVFYDFLYDCKIFYDFCVIYKILYMQLILRVHRAHQPCYPLNFFTIEQCCIVTLFYHLQQDIAHNTDINKIELKSPILCR